MNVYTIYSYWLVVTGCHCLAFSQKYWVYVIIPIDEVFGCHFWHFPRNIGFMSSSQLTKSDFSEGWVYWPTNQLSIPMIGQGWRRGLMISSSRTVTPRWSFPSHSPRADEISQTYLETPLENPMNIPYDSPFLNRNKSP